MDDAVEKLHIFLVSGKTFTFADVTILSDNETMLVFQYGAVSDGRLKTATFFKQHVAGISILEGEE